MSLVSIIMPTYNSGEFVTESINSIVNQRYKNWELIIVDDCSEDNTVEIIEKNYSSDVRIKLYKNDINSGAGVTRNKGLEKASGDWIAFLDSDDFWNSSKLDIQVKHLVEEKSDIVHTSYTFIDEGGRLINGKVLASPSVDLGYYMKNTEIGMSTAIINKKNVGEFSFSEMRTRQDTNLWLTLLSQGYRSEGINQELVSYRVRKGQISGNKSIIAFRTLKLYLGVKTIPVYLRLYNFVYYAINGVYKRIRKNNVV